MNYQVNAQCQGGRTENDQSLRRICKDGMELV